MASSLYTEGIYEVIQRICTLRGLLGTLHKLDGNATTAAKTIWLKQVIVKKVCLPSYEVNTA